MEKPSTFAQEFRPQPERIEGQLSFGMDETGQARTCANVGTQDRYPLLTQALRQGRTGILPDPSKRTLRYEDC